jgi:AcrR family transcriptional regulator
MHRVPEQNSRPCSEITVPTLDPAVATPVSALPSTTHSIESHGMKPSARALPTHPAKPPAPATPEPAAGNKRKTDERVLRSRQRLGMALIELMCDKPFDEVTVQEILDRASVGRSTFYLHFSDKSDLLLTQLETFLETMSTSLINRQDPSHRVVPVGEMFAHIAAQIQIYRALADAGRLHDFFDLAQGHFSRGIARRLALSKRLPPISQTELNARAAALAGSLLSLFRWWLEHGTKESPAVMDDLFHRMVWNGFR